MPLNREHRDSTRLVCADWNAFRDPDAFTYGAYVSRQDDQETYVEGLLDRFERENHATPAAGCSPPTADAPPPRSPRLCGPDGPPSSTTPA